jgi:hypothetical protein
MMVLRHRRKIRSKESGEGILRDVEREMAKPRLAESARRVATVDPAVRKPSPDLALIA